MPDTTLETIEKEAAKLSIQDHILLIEALARQLREKSKSTGRGLDWSALYGLGKGLWGDQDAQEYVNTLREDRE